MYICSTSIHQSIMKSQVYKGVQQCKLFFVVAPNVDMELDACGHAGRRV